MIETTTQRAVRVLNELHAQDPEAVASLLCWCIPINSNKFAEEHPTIQFASNPSTGNARLTLLGLINGMVGDPKGLCVASEWSEPKEDGTRTLLGFCETEVHYAESI